MAEEGGMNQFHRCGMIGSLLVASATALAADAGTPADPLVNPLASWSLDRLSATHERPLFAPTRRPPPPPPPPPVVRQVEAPPAPPPMLILLGIVSDADGTRAWVRTDGFGKVIGARLGDDIGGWKVTQIESRTITLSLGERSSNYVLFTHMNGGNRAPTAAPPEARMQNLAEDRVERRSRR
jgi:general secretion pathway protein N